MLKVFFDQDLNKLVLITDDPTFHYFLETKTSNYEYIPWQKKWGYVEKEEKIYETGRKIKHSQPY